jgi:hypothetical protein
VLTPRIRAALVVLAASAGLGACTNMGPFGGIGVGVGSSPYGYGYGSPYGYGYGSPYGSYYAGYPYYGWYDGFYYPGSGYWIYDPDGNQFPITERQANYWTNVRKKFQEARGTTATADLKPNFSAFSAKARAGATIRGVDLNAQADQRSLQQIRDVRRQARIERQQAQSEARSERQQSVRQIIQERRETRRARRGGGE